jgi:hypothetical protein
MRIYKTLEIMPDEDFPFIEDCSLGIGELLAEANCPNCGNEHPQEKLQLMNMENLLRLDFEKTRRSE